MGELASMRKAYGEALVELGSSRSDVVVLSADVSNSDYSYMFRESFPDRFVSVGIAEQALVDVAVGLAHVGLTPFANSFSFLLATRALEMIRTQVCITSENVKLMAAYGGLSPSFEGPTHHAITDLAIIRSLPNIALVVPSDPIAVTRLLPKVAEWSGPVYFRNNRNELPVIHGEAYAPEIGTAMKLRDGVDVALIATGLMVGRCLEAAEVLAVEKVEARVIEVHTLKPLDVATLVDAARETGAIVTAEEHTVIGGLGSAVAEVTSSECPVPVKRVGINDRFAESGPYNEMLEKYGLSVQEVVSAAHSALHAKRDYAGEASL